MQTIKGATRIPKKLMLQTSIYTRRDYWMLNKRFRKDMIIMQQQQEHYMNPQKDLLDNRLTTRPTQTGWKTSIKLYVNLWFAYIEDAHHQFGISSVPSWTAT